MPTNEVYALRGALAFVIAAYLSLTVSVDNIKSLATYTGFGHIYGTADTLLTPTSSLPASVLALASKEIPLFDPLGYHYPHAITTRPHGLIAKEHESFSQSFEPDWATLVTWVLLAFGVCCLVVWIYAYYDCDDFLTVTPNFVKVPKSYRSIALQTLIDCADLQRKLDESHKLLEETRDKHSSVLDSLEKEGQSLLVQNNNLRGLLDNQTNDNEHLQSRLDAIQQQISERDATLQETRADLGNAHSQLRDLESSHVAIQQQISERDATLQVSRADLANARSQLRDLESSHVAIQQQISERDATLQETRADLGNAQSQLRDLECNKLRHEQANMSLSEDLDRNRAELHLRHRDLDAARTAAQASQREHILLRTQYDTLQSSHKTALAEHQAVTTELSSLREQLNRRLEELLCCQQTNAVLSKQFRQEDSANDDLTAENSTLQKQVDQFTQQISDATAYISAMQAHYDSLIDTHAATQQALLHAQRRIEDLTAAQSTDVVMGDSTAESVEEVNERWSRVQAALEKEASELREACATLNSTLADERDAHNRSRAQSEELRSVYTALKSDFSHEQIAHTKTQQALANAASVSQACEQAQQHQKQKKQPQAESDEIAKLRSEHAYHKRDTDFLQACQYIPAIALRLDGLDPRLGKMNLRKCLTKAVLQTHPDKGGSNEAFRFTQAATAFLLAEQKVADDYDAVFAAIDSINVVKLSTFEAVDKTRTEITNLETTFELSRLQFDKALEDWDSLSTDDQQQSRWRKAVANELGMRDQCIKAGVEKLSSTLREVDNLLNRRQYRDSIPASAIPEFRPPPYGTRSAQGSPPNARPTSTKVPPRAQRTSFRTPPRAQPSSSSTSARTQPAATASPQSASRAQPMSEPEPAAFERDESPEPTMPGGF